ncbi:MAG: hypothetical protein MK209_05150 [Planctomycetes bacterium]|nr:hypothetical protein [Planctomycetota bacterium]
MFEVLGIRFCAITPEADQLVETLGLGLGFPCVSKPLKAGDPDSLQGGMFPAGKSWIEVWPEGEGMPPGIMLQVEVDDADAVAEHARAQGLNPQGPMLAHGERIYSLLAPGGLAMTFQSKVGVEASSD